MKRHATGLLAVTLLGLTVGSCAREDVTGVPAMSASRSAAPNALRNVILFSASADGNGQLAIMNPDGSGRQFITHDPQHQYGASAISPDGRRIVVSRFTVDGFFLQSDGLYLMNADGSDERFLVKRNDIADNEPAWSPDGSQIAFQTFDWLEFGPASRIYVINVDATGLRKVSPPTDNDFVFDDWPAWSPDGTKLVFTRDWQGLSIINADGTGLTTVPNIDAAFTPAWSPDGTRIAFTAASGGIDIVNIDGSNRTTLTGHGSSPGWSPDGRRLVFVNVVSGLSRLFVINADGTGETRLSFGNSDLWARWSPFPPSRSDAGAAITIAPTATKLSFGESRQFSATVRTTNGGVLDHPAVQWSSSNPAILTVSTSGVVTAVDYGTALIEASFGGNTARAEVRVVDRVLRNAILYSTDEFGAAQYAVVRPDGSARRQLTTDPVNYDTPPDLSPDGRQIVFTKFYDIFVMDVDVIGVTEGNTDVLFDPFAPPTVPVWSPDGAQIAFVSGGRVSVVNKDGSGRRQVTPDDPAADDAPTWSPDGSRIAFTRGAVLHVIGADGNGLTSLGADASEPDWSPDGTRIAYASPAGIVIRNADGSNPVSVTTTSGDAHPRWSPESGRLVFARVVDGKSQLFVINANGTGETRVSAGTGSESAPSWSPVP